MITDHEIWKELKPYVFKEKVSNQPRRTGIRYRREISHHIPNELLVRAAQVKVKCVSCKRLMHPVRVTDWHSYVNVVCDFKNHEEGHACARKRSLVKKAIEELESQITSVRNPNPRQLGLWQ